MAIYDEGSQQMGASMMMTEQYEEECVEQYGDQSFGSKMGVQDISGAGKLSQPQLNLNSS